MTNDEKGKIVELRGAGMGYLRIAQTLGVNVNTVKSFCRRHNLVGNQTETPDLIEGVYRKPCRYCSKSVTQIPGRKEKKFCSDACRSKWWNAHLSQVNRKAMYEYTCPHCGKRFSAYGNRNRKYCSHSCYIADRFGGAPC